MGNAGYAGAGAMLGECVPAERRLVNDVSMFSGTLRGKTPRTATWSTHGGRRTKLRGNHKNIGKMTVALGTGVTITNGSAHFAMR